MKRLSLAILAVSLSVCSVYAQTYSIDPDHSNVNFTIRHLVGKVTGHFKKFQGTFNYEPGNAKNWKAEATIEAASIDTGIEKRDNHLRTADFFDVQKYPTITFKSTGVSDVQGARAKLHGDFTMHGVTKPVTLDLEVSGPMKDPWGGQRAGATAIGRINRKDFGITFNKVMDAGSLMLGDEVDIIINIEGLAKK